MAESNVKRLNRACRQCGGHYFMVTISCLAALVGMGVALGGIAIAFLGGGGFHPSDPGSVSGGVAAYSNTFHDLPVAVGGVLIGGLVMILGRRHRCINCDTRK